MPNRGLFLNINMQCWPWLNPLWIVGKLLGIPVFSVDFRAVYKQLENMHSDNNQLTVSVNKLKNSVYIFCSSNRCFAFQFSKFLGCYARLSLVLIKSLFITALIVLSSKLWLLGDFQYDVKNKMLIFLWKFRVVYVS